MNRALKIAAQVILLLTALGGALYAFDSTYVRNSEFGIFVVNYYQDQVDQIQRRIWEYEDRLAKDPKNQMLKERLRELRQQLTRAEAKTRG